MATKPKNVKTVWLDRQVHPKGPFLVLALTDAEVKAVFPGNSLPSGGARTMWDSVNLDQPPTCVVALATDCQKPQDPTVIGILAHEAYHVAMRHFEYLMTTGDEESVAYAVQYITMTLYKELTRRAVA